jgi:hypothetical protein
MTWQRSILIAAILLFAVVYYGLAAIALRDLWHRPAVRGDNKTGWALAILCLPILGAILYGYLGTPGSLGRAGRAPEPEFTPFDHLFEDDDFWRDSTR